jgi:hypothetical protein
MAGSKSHPRQADKPILQLTKLDILNGRAGQRRDGPKPHEARANF